MSSSRAAHTASASPHCPMLVKFTGYYYFKTFLQAVSRILPVLALALARWRNEFPFGTSFCSPLMLCEHRTGNENCQSESNVCVWETNAKCHFKIPLRFFCSLFSLCSRFDPSARRVRESE